MCWSEFWIDGLDGFTFVRLFCRVSVCTVPCRVVCVCVCVWERVDLAHKFIQTMKAAALVEKSKHHDNGSVGIWRWNFRESLWAFSSFWMAHAANQQLTVHASSANNNIHHRVSHTNRDRKLICIANTFTHKRARENRAPTVSDALRVYRSPFICKPLNLDIYFYC